MPVIHPEPEPEPDCIGYNPEVIADGAKVVVCGPACLEVEPGKKKFDRVPHVDKPAPVAAEIRGTDVCRGSTCKAIGTQLAAAIADLQKHAKGDDTLQVFATDDVEMVVVHLSMSRGLQPELWSTAKDAPVKLTRPGNSTEPNPPGPELTAIGNVVLADWYDCAGPCHTGQLVDTRGRQIGDLIDGYTTVWRVSDDLFAIRSDTEGTRKKPPDEVRLYDLRTGKARGKVPVPPNSVGDMIPFAKGHAALVSKSDKGERVIDLDISRASRPKIAAETTLPSCP